MAVSSPVRLRRRFRNRTKHIRNRTSLAATPMMFRVARKIALTDDTNHMTTTVDDRHSSHLMTRHLAHAVVKRTRRLTRKGIVRHAVVNARVTNVCATCYESHCEIAIRDHSDETSLAIDYRKSSAIAVSH
jgi:hypothetical protein